MKKPVWIVSASFFLNSSRYKNNSQRHYHKCT